MCGVLALKRGGVEMTDSLCSPALASLAPYVPGEQPAGTELIKLNTNENPFPPSPAVAEALHAAAEAVSSLRLYPDPESQQLRQSIAGYHAVACDNVFVGNGSDEVLAHAFNAFFRQSKPLLFPDISYGFYAVYCGLYDIAYQNIPLDQAFCLPLDDFAATENGGIIFPNPNAPTGIGTSLDSIAELLEKNRDSVVVVDEAYIDFSADSDSTGVISAIELTQRYRNLLVVRTLSKSRALAGLRLGYAIGDAALIEALRRVKNCFNSYPIDRLAEVAAIASFGDEGYFRDSCQRVIAARQSLSDSLLGLGFDCLPSSANFIMATHGALSAADLAQKLRQQGIIVRYFDRERLDCYLRITVGTAEQNQCLIAALQQLLPSP